MANLADRLGEALATRYRIERELGRGGMATVYLAQDLRHDRPVALKVLHPDLAVTLGSDRFLREIKLCARLQHPHILTVHDSGTVPQPGAAEMLWFSMPFIEGESLRDRLRSEKQLPVDQALRIARETADALDYAHRHGVIHRDVKPENILLSEGHALVADFGIGRALSDSETDEKLTETGLVVGTPAYMSPEQAAGERELDARSDVYSLSVVLYEMLAGEPPFTGPTAQAIAARRLRGEAPSVRQLRPSVPEAVEQAIRKAMAAVAADRFATAAEFSRALAEASVPAPAPSAPAARPAPRHRSRSAVILLLGFVLGIGVLFGWLRRHGPEAPDDAAGPRRLAVLPFENLGVPEEEYFADGVADEIRGKLAGLPGLQVTARSSSAQYKRTTKSPAEIGQELGVDYLLTGTVRWEKGVEGSRVRVSPELIRVATGAARWQQPFDAALSDVFKVQADIAGRVAEALNLALEVPQQRELAERPTSNVAAYDAYLKGEETAAGVWGTDPAQLRRAAAYYEQAVALDSTFALAWAQLSRVLSYAYIVGTPNAADAARARLAADRALAIAPGRAEGRLARGDYYRNITKDHPRSLADFSEGVRLAPRNVDLLTAAALAQQNLGRWGESLRGLEAALELDPRSATTARRLGFTLLWMRRYPEALAASDRALDLEASHLQARSSKVMTYLAQGDLAGAREVLRASPPSVDPTVLVAYIATYWDLFWVLEDHHQQLLLRLTPRAFDNDRGTWGQVLAQTYALRGDTARARAYADSASVAFAEQVRDTPDDAQWHVLLGLALAYAGRKAEAIREGERGVALLSTDEDAYTGAYNEHQLSRIYIRTGEYEKALDRLEKLLRIPYYLSPGWLQLDPTFDPIRKHPRFQKLLR